MIGHKVRWKFGKGYRYGILLQFVYNPRAEWAYGVVLKSDGTYTEVGISVLEYVSDEY